MELSKLLKELTGIHTINSAMLALNVSKEKAIYYIYRLKKAGYVRTKRSHNKIRIYDISPTNKMVPLIILRNKKSESSLDNG